MCGLSADKERRMMMRGWVEIVFGFVLLAGGLAAIFTGSPWAGFFLVILAFFIFA
jgi:hypothetical protein